MTHKYIEALINLSNANDGFTFRQGQVMLYDKFEPDERKQSCAKYTGSATCPKGYKCITLCNKYGRVRGTFGSQGAAPTRVGILCAFFVKATDGKWRPKTNVMYCRPYSRMSLMAAACDRIVPKHNWHSKERLAHRLAVKEFFKVV